MKALPKIFFLALAVLVLTVPTADAAKLVNTGFGKTAIKGYDTVAYFTQGAPVKGSKEFKHKWNGATWRFSSAENLELFKANPAKYAPQYGGWCAFAMALGKKVKIDPKAWHIHEDKLYLNYTPATQDLWLGDKEAKISDANVEWQGILSKN